MFINVLRFYHHCIMCSLSHIWSILLKPRIFIYPHPHFTAVKEVDQDAGRVTYFIPIGNAIHTYQEPIINGHNDNPNSFGEIRDTGLNDRISKVRSLFHQLNGDEDTLKKFYEESGIKLPENEPLMV